MTGMRFARVAFLLAIFGIQECSAIDACINPIEGATKCSSGEDYCEHHLDNEPGKSCLKYCHERGLVCESACNDLSRCQCEEGGSTAGDCYRTWSSALCRCSNNTALMPPDPPPGECQKLSEFDHHIRLCSSGDGWCEYHQEAQDGLTCDQTCRMAGLACESSCDDGGTCECDEERTAGDCYQTRISKLCRCSSDPALIAAVPTKAPFGYVLYAADRTAYPTQSPTKMDPVESSSSGLLSGETAGVAIGAVAGAIFLVFIA